MMKLRSELFVDGSDIPAECAFCVIDPVHHVAMSSNKNPDLAWSDAPARTKSFVVICHDKDVPSRGDDVNQEGKTVPADLPRVDFFHWVLVNLPAGSTGIAKAQFSNEVTPRGKSGPALKNNARLLQGLNDYTSWFAGDAEMAGDYFGYDGPCPPWNDSIIHHYVFTVYALDVDIVPVNGKFTGQQVRQAIQGHILGQAQLTGTYTLNPAVANARN